MQIKGAPGAVFTNEQLLFYITGIGGRVAAIGTCPVLRYIPVGTGSTITGSYFAL